MAATLQYFAVYADASDAHPTAIFEKGHHAGQYVAQRYAPGQAVIVPIDLTFTKGAIAVAAAPTTSASTKAKYDPDKHF